MISGKHSISSFKAIPGALDKNRTESYPYVKVYYKPKITCVDALCLTNGVTQSMLEPVAPPWRKNNSTFRPKCPY